MDIRDGCSLPPASQGGGAAGSVEAAGAPPSTRTMPQVAAYTLAMRWRSWW
ncbi:hypothetical protein OHQ89_07650 [Streptomyces canus]|uniref:hypothetical protein n=1 Tax=Streptomyces canus TaxID=58343 RepID=UPI0030E2A8CC